jgi:hypothetical protein
MSGFAKPSGNPKYVKGKVPVEQPKVFARKCSFCSLTFMGSIMDFFKLTLKPVASEKVLITYLRKVRCLVSPSSTIKVSSAYCNIGKSSLVCIGIGSLRRPMLFSFVNQGLQEVNS